MGKDGRIRRGVLNFCSYLLTLVLLLVVFAYMMPEGHFDMLKRFSAWDVGVMFFLSLGGYVGNGLEYYQMSSKIGFSMDRRDILFLPLGMNLAGTLLLIQGAMAYQLFFFKKKYGVAICHGMAITGFLYLLTMSISGIAGIVIFAMDTSITAYFLAVSILFAMSPLLAMGMLFCLRRIHVKWSLLNRFSSFVCAVLDDIAMLLKDIRTVVILVVIYLLRLLSMVILFAWIARCLGYEVSFLALLLLNLWNMLSLLLKVTPNNLGISQLVSGAMFAMISLPKEQGVMISFVATLVCLPMAFVFGSLAVGIGLWEISARASANAGK